MRTVRTKILLCPSIPFGHPMSPTDSLFPISYRYLLLTAFNRSHVHKPAQPAFPLHCQLASKRAPTFGNFLYFASHLSRSPVGLVSLFCARNRAVNRSNVMSSQGPVCFVVGLGVAELVWSLREAGHGERDDLSWHAITDACGKTSPTTSPSWRHLLAPYPRNLLDVVPYAS